MRILRNLSSRNYQSDKKADGKREKYTKNMHFPACVRVASAVRSLQGVSFTAAPSMKLRSGIAEIPLTKESITARAVSRCMNPYGRRLLLEKLMMMAR